jgi:hypothetical protein
VRDTERDERLLASAQRAVGEDGTVPVEELAREVLAIPTDLAKVREIVRVIIPWMVVHGERPSGIDDGLRPTDLTRCNL